MFELILKGHAEGEAEARSQREEETDQAAAATNDLGEKDTGPRQVKLKSYPQDSFGAQNRSFHHSWYICVVKFHYDPVILSLVLYWMQAKLQSKITLFLIKPIYELSETMDIRGPKWALKKKIAARKHATPLGAKPPLSLNPRNAPASWRSVT